MKCTLSIPHALLAAAAMFIAVCGYAHAASLPSINTETSASITATTATLGGNVISNGGAPVTALGVVYAPTATNANPRIGGLGVTRVPGTGTGGVFTVNVSGLAQSTAYTFAAYATNSVGTGYSLLGSFNTLASFTYRIFGSVVSITGYGGAPPAALTIPPTISGLPVTSIGESAFSRCTGLTSVIIPGSMTDIGSDAFYGCTGLTSVTIPSSVTRIGGSAFDGCSGLSSAIFAGNAPTMGSHVFQGTGSGFTVYYYSGATGFVTPTWTDSSGDIYPSVNLGSPQSVAWRVAKGYSITTSELTLVPKLGGMSLLMAYALNLDPTSNQAANLPKAVVAEGQMSYTFFAGNTDLSYQVQASTDLHNWSAAGVVVSAPDGNGNCTATVPLTSGLCFLRLVVSN